MTGRRSWDARRSTAPLVRGNENARGFSSRIFLSTSSVSDRFFFFFFFFLCQQLNADERTRIARVSTRKKTTKEMPLSLAYVVEIRRRQDYISKFSTRAFLSLSFPFSLLSLFFFLFFITRSRATN